MAASMAQISSFKHNSLIISQLIFIIFSTKLLSLTAFCFCFLMYTLFDVYSFNLSDGHLNFVSSYLFGNFIHLVCVCVMINV